MTPTQPAPLDDAGAMAVFADCSEKLRLYYQRSAEYVGGVEHSDLQERITEARAHLAARLAEDADEIFRLNARLIEETNRATRAEAELAAVRALLAKGHHVPVCGDMPEAIVFIDADARAIDAARGEGR